MPLPKDDEEPANRDSRDAPNAPAVGFSPRVGDGKASTAHKRVRTDKKRDVLVSIRDFLLSMLAMRYFEKRGKRLRHYIDRINEVV